MQRLERFSGALNSFRFEMPSGVVEHTAKIGHAARSVFDFVGTGVSMGYEAVRRKVTVGTFVLDAAFKEQALAHLAKARAQASQAGVTGFAGLLAGFALVAAALVAINRYTDLFISQETKTKNALAQFKEGKITAAACRERLVLNSVDAFTLPGIKELAMEKGGADKIKELLGEVIKGTGRTLWASNIEEFPYLALLGRMLQKEGGLERAVALLNFYEKDHRSDNLTEQFDHVEPILLKMAEMKGGKEAIKTFLNQDTSHHCKLLVYEGMFEKVKKFVDALPMVDGKPFFTSTDLKEILISRYNSDDPYRRSFNRIAAIDSPTIFAAAMPWLERIVDDPEGGRQMILELLSLVDPTFDSTPLHNAAIVPHAIQLLNRLKPAPTDEEMRPLLLAEQWSYDPRAPLFSPSKIYKVPFYNVPLFLFAVPWLLRFIEKNDEKVIDYTKRFMTYAGDPDFRTINLLDPKVFTAAKPLVEAMAKQNRLALQQIEAMFTRCQTPQSYNLGEFIRVIGTPAAPIFDLENLKWILSLCEQLKFDKRKVYNMLKDVRNDTDLTVLHTPGALALAKPLLDSLSPQLTLCEKLKLLFEEGSSATHVTGAKSLSEETFHPLEITIFERNFEEAKKWIDESSPTTEDSFHIKRCILAWISVGDATQRARKRGLVVHWLLVLAIE